MYKFHESIALICVDVPGGAPEIDTHCFFIKFLKDVTMNPSRILPSIALAMMATSAASVFAQTPAAQPVTRAEVKQELDDARKAGELNQNMSHNLGENAAATGPGKSRAQVKAELTDAENKGQLNHSAHDYPAGVTKPATTKGKTRAQVQEELAKAKKDGTFKTPRD
jgi:hypothetical protein